MILFQILILFLGLNGIEKLKSASHNEEKILEMPHKIHFDAPPFFAQNQLPQESRSLISMPSQEDFRMFIETLHQKSLTSREGDNCSHLFSERERREMVYTICDIYKAVLDCLSIIDEPQLKKPTKEYAFTSLGIAFVALVDRVNILLKNIVIRSADRSRGVTTDQRAKTVLDDIFLKKWFHITKYILVQLEHGKLIHLPTAKKPFAEFFFRERADALAKNSKQLSHKTLIRIAGDAVDFKHKLGLLYITEGVYIPFLINTKKEFGIDSLPFYSDLFTEQGFLGYITIKGNITKGNGLFFEKSGEGDLISIFTGTEDTYPLRKQIISEARVIPDVFWEQITYLSKTVFNYPIGFMPFYENETEKQYLQIVYQESFEQALNRMLTSENPLEYQQNALALEYDIPLKHEEGEKEDDIQKERDEIAIQKEVALCMIAQQEALKKQREKSEQELQKQIFDDLVRKEQQKRSEAVAAGATAGKQKSSKAKKGKGKAPQKTIKQPAKQLLPLSMKAELEAEARKIVERNKQEARCKLHMTLHILNQVSKEIDEVASKYELPQESSEHISTKGSHLVGHCDEGALLPFAFSHSGRSKDAGMQARHINDFIEHYVDIKLLKKAEKLFGIQ
jgi:hypothetical protein